MLLHKNNHSRTGVPKFAPPFSSIWKAKFTFPASIDDVNFPGCDPGMKQNNIEMYIYSTCTLSFVRF